MPEKRQPETAVINGRELSCQFCGNTTFWRQEVLIDPDRYAEYSLGWSDAKYNAFICSSCNHVHWFLA